MPYLLVKKLAWTTTEKEIIRKRGELIIPQGATIKPAIVMHLTHNKTGAQLFCPEIDHPELNPKDFKERLIEHLGDMLFTPSLTEGRVHGWQWAESHDVYKRQIAQYWALPNTSEFQMKTQSNPQLSQSQHPIRHSNSSARLSPRRPNNQ